MMLFMLETTRLCCCCCIKILPWGIFEKKPQTLLK